MSSDWDYDPNTGFHYNPDEGWGYYDGDYGPESDRSGEYKDNDDGNDDSNNGED